jgi:V/A-type H+-transporting ATPase subunit I
LGLAKLSKVTMFVPRGESAGTISRLAEFEWFHPIDADSKSDYIDPKLDDLILRSQKQYQSIDEIVRSLNIKTDIGIMDTMIKGVRKDKINFEADEIESLINEIDNQSENTLKESRQLISEISSINRELEELQSMKDTLHMVSKLNINIENMKEGWLFYQGLYIINTRDLAEIQRSLDGVTLLDYPINESQSALFIFSSSKDFERVNKVIRSFDVNPFSIPKSLPQNPKLAYEHIVKRIDELNEKKKQIDSKSSKFIKEHSYDLLSYRESSMYCKDILDSLRKPGGLKNFAIIQGYIPTDMSEDFRKITTKWYSVIDNIKSATDEDVEVNPNIPKHDMFNVEDVLLDKENNEHKNDAKGNISYIKKQRKLIPTLFSNRKYFRSFEPITLTQGFPRNDEFDPTPMISFIFPVLYGLMFGDLGQGAVIAGLGAVFRIRGVGTLQRWGTLLIACGISAMIVGLIVGELFGFHIQELPGAEFLKSTGFIGFLNAVEFNQENVMTILTISINIGIIHLVSALSLNIYKGLKEGKSFEVYSQRLPTLIMYLAIISILLAAVGAQYQVLTMFENKSPAPFFSNIFGNWVTVEIVAKIASPILIATMVIQIVAVPIGVKRGKVHFHGSLGEEMFMTVIEVMLIRVVELFANTISYSRIGIMLLVHVALMATANGGVEFYLHQGNMGAAIGMLLLGNIGVMMMEGLLVYIQALRLHLYEWFTKFFEGNGISFKKVAPDLVYTNIIWQNKR